VTEGSITKRPKQFLLAIGACRRTQQGKIGCAWLSGPGQSGMRVAFQARADQLLASAGQALGCDPFSTNMIAVTVRALPLGRRPTVTRTVGHGRGHEGQVVGLAMRFCGGQPARSRNGASRACLHTTAMAQARLRRRGDKLLAPERGPGKSCFTPTWAT